MKKAKKKHCKEAGMKMSMGRGRGGTLKATPTRK